MFSEIFCGTSYASYQSSPCNDIDNSAPISPLGDTDTSYNSSPISSLGNIDASYNSSPISSHGDTDSSYDSSPISSHEDTDSSYNSSPISSHGDNDASYDPAPISSLGDASYNSAPMMSSDYHDVIHNSSPITSASSGYYSVPDFECLLSAFDDLDPDSTVPIFGEFNPLRSSTPLSDLGDDLDILVDTIVTPVDFTDNFLLECDLLFGVESAVTPLGITTSRTENILDEIASGSSSLNSSRKRKLDDLDFDLEDIQIPSKKRNICRELFIDGSVFDRPMTTDDIGDFDELRCC